MFAGFGFFGKHDVCTLEHNRDVDGLIRLLTHEKNRTIKIEASEALGNIGDDRAVSSLLSRLVHDDNDVRMFAAIASERSVIRGLLSR